MRIARAAIVFLPLFAYAGVAAALTPQELTPAELSRYEKVKADPKAAESFLATRDYVKKAEAINASPGDKQLALKLKRPKNFDTRYLVKGEVDTLNKAIELSLDALAEELISDKAPAAGEAEVDAFLKSIGLDPASEEVRVAKEAGEVKGMRMGDPVVYSVASLAGEKKKKALLSFVKTRAFYAKLKKDFAGTALPTENYEADFLTYDERQLVGKKVADSLRGKP